VLLGALVVTGLLAGCHCGPHVRRFEVTPPVVCGDAKAVVRWSADGELAIAMNPEGSSDGPSDCSPLGHDVLKLTLVASKHGEEKTGEQEVAWVRGAAAEPVLLGTTAVEATDVVARGEKNKVLWSDAVEVVTVTACGRRQISVRHAGKTAPLPADATPSAAFEGTALSGAWELRSPMSPQEQSKPSLRPKTLAVLATIRCKPEKR
jgi:hypothetical protein